METKFWQTRVKITQIPTILERQRFFSQSNRDSVEIDMSWLFDPFLDQTVYGLELTLNKTFSFTFFMRAETESKALKRGYSFLMSLEGRFPGLTGEVSTLPVSLHTLRQGSPIYELILPRVLLLNGDRFHIIQKLIQLFKVRDLNIFQFFLFWQKDDSSNIRMGCKVSALESYKLKIFVRVIKDNKIEYNEPQTAELEGKLEYLTLGIKNIKGERARIKKVLRTSWMNIKCSNVFWVNDKNLRTGPCYRDIYEQLPEERRPAFVTPDQVDFTFSSDLPLQKSLAPPLENINYSSIGENDKNSISLGPVLVKGVETKIIKCIPTSHFAHSVFIGGQTGQGKTHYLGHICNQFYKNAPDIGVLILNLGKGEQERFYLTDDVLEYGSPNLHLSYFYEGEHLDKSLQETATYLVGALGLSSPSDKIMYNVMNAFIKVNGRLPLSLKTLFNGLEKYFIDHPYHKKFQTYILRALQVRIPSLLADPTLRRTLKLSPGNSIPKWFHDWKAGKTIFINLGICNIHIKRLLANAIFQMVKTLTPDVEAGKLQNIIVVDEAYNILEEIVTKNYWQDDAISRDQLELIFNNLIKEFRSKGLSFFIADNTAHRLFSCAVSLPRLKILFGLGHKDSSLFTNNLKTQEYLLVQKKYHALIWDNEEIYVIRSPNYTYSKQPEMRTMRRNM
ncbi:hypothetical protein LCGC14_0497020 [marine sediment metagenome]|uniref:Helicase HerA central domain-containing protein n=1 Tax=marine sediment metagenome TaxID=412755 RepID=A0A0F9SA68_9ZZZZ